MMDSGNVSATPLIGSTHREVIYVSVIGSIHTEKWSYMCPRSVVLTQKSGI